MSLGETLLRIKVLVDASQASKGLDQAAGKTKSMGSSLKSVGKAVAGGLAVGAVLSFGKATVSAAQESALATNKLDAVFKAMGDTTGKASKAAQDYATALSNRTGIDDEAIMKGQALLATFGAVSSETARSAGIFDRATQAGADLAAAGFGTLDSNAVQLGKALQDPTKGLTALGRSGVTFTDSQKKAIAQMQKSGDLLGAQKEVLAAVESQVKGTAEATGTAADKQAVAYGNMQEAIGAKLLPVVERLQTVLMGLFNFLGNNANVLVPVIAGIIALAVVMKGIILVSQAVAAVNALVGASWWASVWPVLLVIAAIAAVIAIMVLLYMKCQWFRDAVQTVMRVAVAAFNGILNAARAVWNWIRSNWPLLVAILLGPIAVAAVLIARNWDAIKAGAVAVMNTIRGVAGAIGAALSGVAHAISAPFIRGFQIVKDAVAAAVGWVSDKIASLTAGISRAIDTVKGVYNSFARAWNSIPEVSLSVPSNAVTKALKVAGLGVTLALPDIPLLASGAYVNRATMAVLGEGRSGEWVLPDAKLRALIRQESGGGATVNVIVPATANPAETGREVAKVLRSFFAAGGRLEVPA
jgi:hypothetical protein